MKIFPLLFIIISSCYAFPSGYKFCFNNQPLSKSFYFQEWEELPEVGGLYTQCETSGDCCSRYVYKINGRWVYFTPAIKNSSEYRFIYDSHYEEIHKYYPTYSNGEKIETGSTICRDYTSPETKTIGYKIYHGLKFEKYIKSRKVCRKNVVIYKCYNAMLFCLSTTEKSIPEDWNESEVYFRIDAGRIYRNDGTLKFKCDYENSSCSYDDIDDITDTSIIGWCYDSSGMKKIKYTANPSICH